jgi:hypothetical protein
MVLVAHETVLCRSWSEKALSHLRSVGKGVDPLVESFRSALRYGCALRFFLKAIDDKYVDRPPDDGENDQVSYSEVMTFALFREFESGRGMEGKTGTDAVRECPSFERVHKTLAIPSEEDKKVFNELLDQLLISMPAAGRDVYSTALAGSECEKNGAINPMLRSQKSANFFPKKGKNSGQDRLRPSRLAPFLR